MYKRELQEIEGIVFQHAQTRKQEENFTRVGLGVPLTRKLARSRFSFSDESPATKLKIWNYAWENTGCYEVMSLCIYIFQHRTISKSEFSTLKRWVDRCYCWEHSDDLSKIYADVVENNPSWILPALRLWNKSPSRWKRRQSVVSLLEYASKRYTFLPFTELLSFVEPLLDDCDYYVQKGVGWTVREIYNVYPAETLRFIRKSILRIQPQAYSAATGKLTKAVKAELNLLRKEGRGLRNA